MDNKMNSFGFAATQTAQTFVAELVRSLQAAAEAGFVHTPAPAYAAAGRPKNRAGN